MNDGLVGELTDMFVALLCADGFHGIIRGFGIETVGVVVCLSPWRKQLLVYGAFAEDMVETGEQPVSYCFQFPRING